MVVRTAPEPTSIGRRAAAAIQLGHLLDELRGRPCAAPPIN